MINLYVQFVSSLNVLGLECNNCHWKGSCIRHGYYQRSYLLNVGDLMSGGTKIKILRVKCKHCGRTHAILPEEIVPYLSFSTVFIYPILWQYYAKEKTIEAICREFQIAVPQLYRWKERFEKQKDRFLGVLKSRRYKGFLTKWKADPANEICRQHDKKSASKEALFFIIILNRAGR